MISLGEFKEALEGATRSAPANGFFLENSLQRELEYSLRSSRRWFEIFRIIRGFDVGGRVLDIGVSPLTFVLKRWWSDIEALDYTDSFHERCARASIKLHVGGDDWERNTDLPEGSYDLIVFLEVIEHMRADPEKVLRFLRSTLRKGGVLIMTTPNLMCLANRKRMLLNQKLIQLSYPAFSDNDFIEHGHKHDRIFMPAEMKEYLMNSGWSVFRMGYQSVDATEFDSTRNVIRRVSRLPIRAIKGLFPSLRLTMLVTAIK